MFEDIEYKVSPAFMYFSFWDNAAIAICAILIKLQGVF